MWALIPLNKKVGLDHVGLDSSSKEKKWAWILTILHKLFFTFECNLFHLEIYCTVDNVETWSFISLIDQVRFYIILTVNYMHCCQIFSVSWLGRFFVIFTPRLLKRSYSIHVAYIWMDGWCLTCMFAMVVLHMFRHARVGLSWMGSKTCMVDERVNQTKPCTNLNMVWDISKILSALTYPTK